MARDVQQSPNPSLILTYFRGSQSPFPTLLVAGLTKKKKKKSTNLLKFHSLVGLLCLFYCLKSTCPLT